MIATRTTLLPLLGAPIVTHPFASHIHPPHSSDLGDASQTSTKLGHRATPAGHEVDAHNVSVPRSQALHISAPL